jgi:predicted metal-binding protein
MLKKIDNGPALVVCTTCRFSRTQRDDSSGRRGGALFVESLRAALRQHNCNGRLKIEEMACLFACSDHCVVQIRDDGKVGYVVGRFSPSTQDAQALLDYVAHYIDSSEGVVPYEKWPVGVKGHFIVRTPPIGFVYEWEGPPRSESIARSDDSKTPIKVV